MLLRCATGKKSHFGSFRQLEQVNCVLHSISWRLARNAKSWTTMPTFFPIAACTLNSDYTMSWAFRSTCCASVGKSPMLAMVASSWVWCCIECRREGLSPKLCVSLIAVDCGESMAGYVGEGRIESIVAEKPISRRDRPLHPRALRRLSLEESRLACQKLQHSTSTARDRQGCHIQQPDQVRFASQMLGWTSLCQELCCASGTDASFPSFMRVALPTQCTS